MRRRDAFRALAGLGLVACDTRKPNRGLLGASEKLGEHVQSFLLSDHVPRVDDPVSPPGAFPVYHVAPHVPVVPDDWKLTVSGKVGRAMRLTLDDLRALPRIEARIRHHSARGWTAVAEWAGVHLSEIAKLVDAKPTRYVELRSFDAPSFESRGYWSSWDRESAMHPQSMIAYEMNGKPLTPEHGAPCRFYGSVKLGYKMVKYLTEVNFLDVRTGGYWENQGYDWFAGV
jgi:DMSO/TMAO reductase YedYZ molybdopterin-dependent catalytic subunit